MFTSILRKHFAAFQLSSSRVNDFYFYGKQFNLHFTKIKCKKVQTDEYPKHERKSNTTYRESKNPQRHTIVKLLVGIYVRSLSIAGYIKRSGRILNLARKRKIKRRKVLVISNSTTERPKTLEVD